MSEPIESSLPSPAKRFLPLKRGGEPGKILRKAAGRLYGKERTEVEKLREVARDFESVFMSQILKQMRGTVDKTGLFHGGLGEDFFTEMLDEELSKSIAQRGDTGIADMLFQQLSRRYNLDSGEENAEGLLEVTQSARALRRKMQAVNGEMNAANASANAKP